MFATIYYILCGILYILSLPFLIFFWLFKPKYKDSIPHRFFLRDTSFKCDVWIHACSLGEINSLEFLKPYLSQKTIISTITNTGYTRALELFCDNKNVEIKFLPFEIFLPFLMPKNIKKLIVFEAELWFMLFFCAKRRGANTILLNARISSKSFPKYKKISFLYKQIFKYIDFVLCQLEDDRDRLALLGAKNIEVFGNIKALNTFKVSKQFDRFDGDLIFAASTHNGEEELILKNYIDSNLDSKKHRLCIAPRHPERFDEVWELLQKYNINCAKFSNAGLDYSYDVILIDKIGELLNIYNVSSVVILGGSFVKVGGHNPLECAFFHTKLISGVYIFNQYALFDLIDNYKIIKDDELKVTLESLESLENSYIKNQDQKLDKLLQYIGFNNG